MWKFSRIHVTKFVGLASAAFAMFQKKSKCSISLMQDEGMMALIMSGIRGGHSFISERLIDTCPMHHPNSHMLYCDANNLVRKSAVFEVQKNGYKFIFSFSRNMHDKISSF